MTTLLWIIGGVAVYVVGMAITARLIGRWFPNETISDNPAIIIGSVLWPIGLPAAIACCQFAAGAEDGRRIAASREFTPELPVVHGDEPR